MIEVKVDTKALNKAVGEFGKVMKSREVPHRQLGVQLFSWVQRNFEQEGGLQSEPWAKLAPYTIAEKARLGYSPKKLVRTGNLRTSFLQFSDNDTAGIGARASYGVDYAAVHELGNDKVPARPMLPPPKVVVDYAIRIYNMHIQRARQESGL